MSLDIFEYIGFPSRAPLIFFPFFGNETLIFDARGVASKKATGRPG